MNTFKPNDKVVCIDATPIPHHSFFGSAHLITFPNGFIKEGAVYCVREARDDAIFIVGPEVRWHGCPFPWSAARFRKVEHSKQRRKRATKKAQPKHQPAST